jgi:hypothetical protein
MGNVLRFRVTEAQRVLARFRAEENAFHIVLDALKEWRRDELFVRVFTLYRARMRHLRKVAGSLLGGVELRSAGEELETFSRARDARRKSSRDHDPR